VSVVVLLVAAAEVAVVMGKFVEEVMSYFRLVSDLP
jgi:hypothetical protein